MTVHTQVGAQNLMASRVVIVVGSGGREHALAWKLAQSSALAGGTVFVAPGNGGTESAPAEGRCRISPLPHASHDALVAFAVAECAMLVVVGPEVPLAEGLAGEWRARAARAGARAGGAACGGGQPHARTWRER